MQKRIDYLIEQRRIANEAMKEAQAIGDPWGYKSAVDVYNVFARELTWLADVQSLVPIKTKSDAYEEAHHEVSIILFFPAVTIPTPLEINLINSEGGWSDSINIPKGGLRFSYSLRFDEFPPARQYAENIIRQYQFNSPLAPYLGSVRFANIALSAIKQMASGINNELSELVYRVQHDLIDDTFFFVHLRNNPYFDRLWDAAKNEGGAGNYSWLVWYALKRNIWEINWQPFPKKAATP